LMNKGLELIEACFLFGVDEQFVEVVVHPQSIVHSMVTYIDGTTLAQLSAPSMCVPIAHALAWPERHSSGVAGLNWQQARTLEFMPLDTSRFPCFELARGAMRSALKSNSCAPAVLNAANEQAVASFLHQKLEFIDIPKRVSAALDQFGDTVAKDVADLIELDQQVRAYVRRL